MSKGKLFVISGPSGVGKGTIANRILEDCGLSFSVSMTTRAPRNGEVDGKDYYFVSHEEFKKTIAEGGFLEYAEVYGNFYGTPLKPILERLENGESILLDIDTVGAENVRKAYPENISIFILPPSLEELKTRIIGRNSESKESLERRLGEAEAVMKCSKDYTYDVINDDLDEAISKVKEIIESERKK